MCACRYLADCHVLDTKTWSWTAVEAAPSPPRRNHLAIWTPSLPNSKSLREHSLLIFGGQTRPQQGADTDKTQAAKAVRLVADASICSSEFNWKSYQLESSPSPRQGAAWVLDTKSSRAPRLILFGGQGGVSVDFCLGDTHELDLLAFDWKAIPIVDAVDPATVPASGGALVVISGRCLDGERISIRFCWQPVQRPTIERGSAF